MIALLLATAFALAIGVIPASQAQTFTVLHNFTGRADGANPYAGVTVGPGGGCTERRQTAETAMLARFQAKQVNSVGFSVPVRIYRGSDGASPEGVGIGPNSALYGTTLEGGEYNYGTVFELRPPLTVCSNTVLLERKAYFTLYGSPGWGIPAS